MKITRLQAENFKKIVAIDVHPDGAIFNVSGKNAQGKSSTLDAIQAALGGKDSMPDVPVRMGEESGAIRLELDDGALIVRRTFDKDGKDQLIVEATTEHGSTKYTAPQKILDGLYGSISFDPLAFTRMKPDEQLQTLKGLVKVDVDLAQLEHDNKVDYDNRRDINRDVSRMEAELLGLPIYDDVPADVLPIENIAEQINKAVEHNTEIENRKARRAAAEETKRSLELKIIDAETALASAKDHLRHINEQLANAEPLPDPIDPTELQKQQEERRNINVKVMANKHHAQKEQLLKVEQLRSAALTKAMEERNKQRDDAIAAADMPVKGLSFGEGHVLFNSVPMAQSSAAEQLRVSIAIGMAMTPKLKVMLVRDASLVDEDGMKLIAEMAAEHDYQFWVETVNGDQTVGIVLEDGAVKGAPTPEPIIEPAKKKPTAAQKAAAAAAQKAMLTEAVEAKIDGVKATFVAVDEGSKLGDMTVHATLVGDKVVDIRVDDGKKTSLFERMANQLEKTPVEDAGEPEATQVPDEPEIEPSDEKKTAITEMRGGEAFAEAIGLMDAAKNAETNTFNQDVEPDDDSPPWKETDDNEDDDDGPQSGPVSFFDDDD